MIYEYAAPENKSPDKFLVELIKTDSGDSEIHNIIKNNTLENDHDYAKEVSDTFGTHISDAYKRMISIVKNKTEWQNYIAPIKEWMENKKGELNLGINPKTD